MIRKPDMTDKEYAEWLQRAGLDWTTCCKMSGYNPKEIERKRTKLVMSISIALVLVTWIMLAAVYAAELKVSRDSEAVLIQCLNKQPVKVGEEWFTCSSLGELK